MTSPKPDKDQSLPRLKGRVSLFQWDKKKKRVGGMLLCPSCKSPTMIQSDSTLGLRDSNPEVVIEKDFLGSYDGSIAEEFERPMTCADNECGKESTLWSVMLPKHLKFGSILTWMDGDIVEFLNKDGTIYSYINGQMKRGRIQWT